MSLYHAPPESLTVGGLEYPIDTDFRAWVQFQAAMTEKGTDGEKAERLCAFMEQMGLPPGEEALEAMLNFYTAASTEKAVAGQKNRPAAFDFEKDSEYIFAAFMGAYDIDLTTARLHWWTFKALFKALPEDCEFCRIMRYRTVDLKDVPKLYHNKRLQGTTTYYVLCYIIKALLSYRVLSRSCVVFLLLPVYLRRCYSHLTL